MATHRKPDNAAQVTGPSCVQDREEFQCPLALAILQACADPGKCVKDCISGLLESAEPSTKADRKSLQDQICLFTHSLFTSSQTSPRARFGIAACLEVATHLAAAKARLENQPYGIDLTTVERVVDILQGEEGRTRRGPPDLASPECDCYLRRLAKEVTNHSDFSQICIDRDEVLLSATWLTYFRAKLEPSRPDFNRKAYIEMRAEYDASRQDVLCKYGLNLEQCVAIGLYEPEPPPSYAEVQQYQAVQLWRKNGAKGSALIRSFGEVFESDMKSDISDDGIRKRIQRLEKRCAERKVDQTDHVLSDDQKSRLLRVLDRYRDYYARNHQ